MHRREGKKEEGIGRDRRGRRKERDRTLEGMGELTKEENERREGKGKGKIIMIFYSFIFYIYLL